MTEPGNGSPAILDDAHVSTKEEHVSRPLFSILTSVYRTERYVPETIDSVLAQTLEDWELVVVDNGLSDEAAAIVHGYDDPRIRLVRQENKGLGGGVDAAAAVATGRYFAVLDSDDVLMPTFCERTAAFLAQHPDVDMVGIDAHLFEDGATENNRVGYRESVGIETPADPDHPVTMAEVIGGDVIYYTAAIRAEAFARGGGYTCDTPKVEDLALFLRMLAAGCQIRVLDEKLSRYRLRGDSFSRDPAHQDAFEASLEKAFVQAGALSDDPEVGVALDRSLRRLRFNRAMRRSRAALLAGDVRVARDEARQAYRQRRSARPAAVVAGLTLAPGVMRRIHPAKQRISAAVEARRRSAATP